MGQVGPRIRQIRGQSICCGGNLSACFGQPLGNFWTAPVWRWAGRSDRRPVGRPVGRTVSRAVRWSDVASPQPMGPQSSRHPWFCPKRNTVNTAILAPGTNQRTSLQLPLRAGMRREQHLGKLRGTSCSLPQPTFPRSPPSQCWPRVCAKSTLGIHVDGAWTPNAVSTLISHAEARFGCH